MTDCLNKLGREFVGVQTDNDVYRAAARVATDLLDADVCTIAVADENELRAQATSGTKSGSLASEYLIDTSIPGTVYTGGDPCRIDDLSDVRSTAAASEPDTTQDKPNGTPEFRSLLVVPFGEIGVLIAADTTPGAFTEADRDTASKLGAFAAAAREGIQSTAATTPDRLDEIASIFSHDLRTPLQVARGRLELAQATNDEDHLSHVMNALDRIEDIADDVVMLARTNERIGSLTPVDLQELVNTAWVTVATPAAGLVVEETSEILANKSTACQLLENLFSNAIEHAGPDVTIRVGTFENGFYVEDDGPGIPPERRDEVFEWRVSSGSDHTGLGLAIVERIAEAHDWDITITDSETGGARFEITGVEFEE